MKVRIITKGLSHDEWLEARSQGIGGSDAGTILGVNPYKGRLELWLEKSGRKPDAFTGNEATRLGQAFERPIAEVYAQSIADQGLVVVAWPVILEGSYDWQLGNVDFFVCRTTDANFAQFKTGVVNDWDGYDAPPLIQSILEIKTSGLAGRGNADAWSNGSVPAGYRAQGCHYASVTGIHDVTFVCLIGGQGIVTRDVTYTPEELFELEQAENRFWYNVMSDTEPEATANDLEALKSQYPVSTDQVVEADDIVLGLYREYKAQKAIVDSADEELKRLRAQLEQIIGSAQAVMYEDEILFTYKSNKVSETFDSKAFKDAHPEIVAQFTVSKPGARVLRMVAE